MNYIVFDLEWNQSASGKRFVNKKIPFEIIEIGAVKLNRNMKEIDRFNELVRPKVYKNINKITGNIVHLDMNQLKNARPFSKVMESFLDFCGKDYVFCTWGNLDLIELQRNMKFYSMPSLSQKPIKFLDVQKLFALQFEGEKSQHTLEYAVDVCGIYKDIPFHRAFADAYYTAKVLKRKKKSEFYLRTITNIFPEDLKVRQRHWRTKRFYIADVICVKGRFPVKYHGSQIIISIIIACPTAGSMD